MNKPHPVAPWRSLCAAALLFTALASMGQAQALQPQRSSAPLQSLLELGTSTLTTRLPTIKAWKLTQDTKVLFVENHALPMIDVQISFAAGSNQDGDSPGLAAMVLSLFNEGSEVKDANALAKGFDSLGVELGNGINKERSYFTLRSLSDANVRDPAMRLLSEMLSRPGFTVEGQRRVKNELLAQLKREHDAPHALAQAQIYDQLYTGHPFTRSVHGSAQSIELINTAQLRAFYRRAYTAANAQIVIVGDLTVQQAQSLSRTLADALPTGPALAEPPPSADSPHTAKTLHIEDEAAHSLLMLAQNALPSQHPDAVAIRAGNVIFSQILNEHLREIHSVTYGVISDIPPAKGTTPWTISLNTPSRYSLSALALIKTLFARFLQEGPNQQELDDIKQFLLRALPQLTASNLEMRQELALISRFDQPLDFNYKIQQAHALTREQIKAAMNRHFSADGWVSVTVGPSVAQLPLPVRTAGEATPEHACTPTNQQTLNRIQRLGAGP